MQQGFTGWAEELPNAALVDWDDPSVAFDAYSPWRVLSRPGAAPNSRWARLAGTSRVGDGVLRIQGQAVPRTVSSRRNHTSLSVG